MTTAQTTLQVGLVLPNYNYGRFLPRLVESLKAQRPEQDFGLANVHCIFVDDGSTDDSILLARTHLPAVGFGRLDILSVPRQGKPGPVRNAGISQLQTEYLFCLDPDDTIDPDCFSTLLRLLRQSPEHVCGVYSSYRNVSAQGNQETVTVPPYSAELLRTQNILPPGCMLRRQAVVDVGGYRADTAYEDWELWVRLAAAGYDFKRHKPALYNHHWHGSNYSYAAEEVDLQAKAGIVLANRNFFPVSVQGWAESAIAGKPWAAPFSRGIIPREEDVRKLRAMIRKGIKSI